MCILTKCTHSTNFVQIGPTVQELWHFLCFHVRPPGGQVDNRIGPKFVVQGHPTQRHICGKFQVNSSSGYKMCHHFGQSALFTQFDLDNWKKQVKSKTRGILCVSLLNAPTVKILSKSDQRFRSYRIFRVFTFGPLVAKSIIGSGRNFFSTVPLPRAKYVASFRSLASAVQKRAI